MDDVQEAEFAPLAACEGTGGDQPTLAPRRLNGAQEPNELGRDCGGPCPVCAAMTFTNGLRAGADASAVGDEGVGGHAVTGERIDVLHDLAPDHRGRAVPLRGPLTVEVV